VARLLGNQYCHGNRFVPRLLGVVLISAFSMKLIGPPGTELRHILTIYIMCPCDLDLCPTFPKIGSRDPEFLLNVHAYLEIHRRFSFWNIKS